MAFTLTACAPSAGGTDAALDAYDPTLDAALTYVHGACTFQSFLAPCAVACDFPESQRIGLDVVWSTPCDERFPSLPSQANALNLDGTDCRCVEGSVMCRCIAGSWCPAGELDWPRNGCDPSFVDPDAGNRGASTDASATDAGSGDAGT